ncbi:MAG: hypothetical protein ABRQ30_00450, partial [Smithellaceae bacterium]
AMILPLEMISVFSKSVYSRFSMPIVFSVMIVVFYFNSLIILNIAVSCPLPAEVSPGMRRACSTTEVDIAGTSH